MKLRRALARGQSVLGQERRGIEIHGFIKASAPGIHIDHFQVFTNGTWFKRFPGNLQRHLTYQRLIELSRQRRIDAVRAQTPECRRRRSKRRRRLERDR